MQQAPLGVDRDGGAAAARAALKADIARLGAGDPSAPKDVYRATSAKLYGIALRILGDERERE